MLIGRRSAAFWAKIERSVYSEDSRMLLNIWSLPIIAVSRRIWHVLYYDVFISINESAKNKIEVGMINKLDTSTLRELVIQQSIASREIQEAIPKSL